MSIASSMVACLAAVFSSKKKALNNSIESTTKWVRYVNKKTGQSVDFCEQQFDYINRITIKEHVIMHLGVRFEYDHEYEMTETGNVL